MRTIASPLLLTLALMLPVAAVAQDSRPTRVDGATAPSTGVVPSSARAEDLTVFIAEVRRLAEESGLTPPPNEEIAAAFRALDSNGDGVLSEAERTARQDVSTCGDRGVCRHGHCFCSPGYTAE